MMFGWLAKKGQDSRVFVCIKEVKWELARIIHGTA